MTTMTVFDGFERRRARDAFASFIRAPSRELRRLMHTHPAPPLDELVGWEFDGVNTLPVTSLVGIRKFRKGFYRGPARSTAGPEPFIQGYNIPVRQDGIDRPHHALPSDELPKRFGFYRVYDASLNRKHHRYPQSILLDYGLGGNGASPDALLRDYVVQIEPGSSDLLLGHAFGTVGILTIPLSFFVIVRTRKHDFVG